MPVNTRLTFPVPELPPFARVSQQLPKDHIDDLRANLREKLLESGLLDSITPGARIAVTAGSRGMGGFVELLGGICDALRSKRAEPFLIPAMGSHGSAKAAGQVEILRRLGVDENDIGAEIRATMDTRPLGKCETGATAHLDSLVAESDGVIVLGRTKTHPENREGIASGLLKMT